MKQQRYLLPDGRTAANMKEGCEMLGVTSRVFRALIKKEEITKTIISKPKEDEYNESNK